MDKTIVKTTIKTCQQLCGDGWNVKARIEEQSKNGVSNWMVGLFFLKDTKQKFAGVTVKSKARAEKLNMRGGKITFPPAKKRTSVYIRSPISKIPAKSCLLAGIGDNVKGKKKNGKPTEGFGLKRNRKYLETDSLPDNFTELWMNNVAKSAKLDFSYVSIYHC